MNQDTKISCLWCLERIRRKWECQGLDWQLIWRFEVSGTFSTFPWEEGCDRGVWVLFGCLLTNPPVREFMCTACQLHQEASLVEECMCTDEAGRHRQVWGDMAKGHSWRTLLQLCITVLTGPESSHFPLC